MNAYQKTIELGLTGTDTEKVAVLHSLAGGRPYADVTVEDLATQAAEAGAEEAKAALVEALNAMRADFDARSNLALRGITDGTITDEAGIAAQLGIVG